MTNDDFKKLLDEAIQPLRDGFKKVQEDQADLRKVIEERVLPPLIYVETTVKSYADRYVTNEDHIDTYSPPLLLLIYACPKRFYTG